MFFYILSWRFRIKTHPPLDCVAGVNDGTYLMKSVSQPEIELSWATFLVTTIPPLMWTGLLSLSLKTQQPLLKETGLGVIQVFNTFPSLEYRVTSVFIFIIFPPLLLQKYLAHYCAMNKLIITCFT